MRPFLKWPGGKRWLVASHADLFPTEYHRYIEPFLGGGSVYFHLAPNQAIISDIDQELINAYHMMRCDPQQLRDLLLDHQELHSRNHYYEVRDDIPETSIERAARFLYLNRTCFNGMYRVNRFGHFNVPIGSKQHFTDDVDLFEEYSILLRRAHIRKQDFVETICSATEGDFVFADPPYTIAHNQNYFIKYNERLFSWSDQKRLLRALVKARDRGVIVLATNANYPELQQMYEQHNFFTCTLDRFSSISGQSAGRGRQNELLISSYPIQNE